MLTASVADHLAWLRLRDLREETTIRQRRRVMERLTRALDRDPLDATEAELLAWQDSLRGLTAQTRRTYVSHVTSYYGWAVTFRLRDDNPTSRLVRPKPPRRLPRPMPEMSLRQAVAAAEQPVRLWLTLGAWAGLRACEIAGLDRSHIRDDTDPPALFVADGKGGHQRIIPLAPVLLRELRSYGIPPRGWLFPMPTEAARHVSAHRVSELCNDHLHALGIADTLHSCRHRYGTELYRASGDLRVVQDAMGHRSPATTSGYVAVSAAAAAAATLLLPDAI